MFTSEIINADGRSVVCEAGMRRLRIVGHDKLPHRKFTIAIVTIYLT